MSFVTALALGLGLLVAAPWLAHRFRRRRADEVAFAPVHLVPATPPRARRRAALEDKALFGVRVAQVLGLALLGATPLVDCSRLALDRGGASVAVVVVVDDSMSMRARSGGATRFERARAAALELVSGLREGDAVGVVLAGAPARVAFAVSTDVRSARDALDRLQPSDRATDLDGALDLAGSMTSELPQLDKRVVLLSDRADGRADAGPLSARGPAGVWSPLDLGEDAADCAVVRAERSGARVRVRVACGPGASADGRSVLLAPAVGGAPLAKVPAPSGAAGDVWLAPGAAPGEDAELVARLDGADALPEDDVAPVTARLRSGELGVVASVAAEAGGPPVVERALTALELDLGLRPLPVVPDRKEDLAGLAALFVDDPPGFGPEVRRVLAAFVERGGVLLVALGPAASAAPIGTGLEPAVTRPLGWGPSPVKGVDLGEGRALLGEGLASLQDFAPKGRAALDPADLAGAEVLVRFADGAPLVLRRPAGRGAVWLVTVPLSIDASDLPFRPAFLGLLAAVADDARRGLAASRSEPGTPWTFPGARAVEVTPPAATGAASAPLPVTRGPSGPVVVPGRLGLHRVKVDDVDEVRVVEPVVRELDLRPRALDAQAPGARTGGAAARTDASWAVALGLLALLALELVLRFARRPGPAPA